jgi:hypothetical protein
MHLAETLPRNLADNPDSVFLVLDYGDGPELREVLSKHRCERLKVYRHENGAAFHVAHAKNMAHRLAVLEGADVLVTLDADNFTGPHFEDFVAEAMKEPGVFLCPDHASIRELSWAPEAERPNRGFAGRLAVRAQDFIKAGGYDESYDTWRGEDIDFNARMGRMGYTMRFIPNQYLKTIPHSADVRFKEYPHARQFDRVGAWKMDGHGTDTVVNYGQIGCGDAMRMSGYDPFFQRYDNAVVIPLKPLPTRIFGIGMHKTATTSLHKAFQILGFDSLHWGRGEAPLIWEEVNAAGRSMTLERFYAASDMPIPLLYKKLDEAYPGSKFILTIRDEQKWLKSVERLWDPEYNPTRWQWDVWPISNRLHKAMYGRTDFDAETMLATYRRHNAEVREYFEHRPDDLLVMDMEESGGWANLCDFLDQPVPSVKYPHEYRTRVAAFKDGSGI